MEFKFKKVHTVKDRIISSVVVIAGIGLYFVNAGLGAVVGVCGILMLLFYKAAYKKVDGGDAVLVKKALDAASSCRNSLIDYLGGKDVEPVVLKPDANGGVVRIEVYYNASESVAYAQLFNFSSYAYEPATEVVELRGPRADKLIGKIA